MLATRQTRRTRLRHLILPVITAGCVAYFGHHAFQGTYGIHSRDALDERLLSLETELAEVSAYRAELEWQVRLLQNGSIERDMVDERARAVLGVVSDRDVVILR
jgi:cell division protein FtsB